MLKFGNTALALTAVALLGTAGYAAAQKFAPAADKSASLDFPPAKGRPSGSAWEFASRESPESAFAFRPAAPGASNRLVIAHYFPPFPLTIGGWTPQTSYYERNYLRPEGEKGKFARGGGFVRQRPLVGMQTTDADLAGPGNGRAANGRTGIAQLRDRQQNRSDFEIQVARAARIGIDAFGVDILQLEGKSTWAAFGLLDAAQKVDPRFRVAVEPDLVAMKDVQPQPMADFLLKFGGHPSALRTADGRLLVMPFGAERRGPEFWEEVGRIMAKQGQRIALIPDFVNPTSSAKFAGISAAGAMWGARDATAGNLQRRFAGDLLGRGYPAWVATAAPQDMRPKSLFAHEAAGSASFTAAMLAGIEGNAAALHLVTWNDYSEGSELAPSSATRFAYYDIAAYYIAWFKAGSQPAITRDGFIGFQRRQLFRPKDTSRGVAWKVRGSAAVDIVEMSAFLTAPAELVITSGGRTERKRAGAGLQRVTVPAATGAVTMAIERSGRTVATCRSPWLIEAAPDRHDPLYAGFSSLRGCN